MRVNLITILLFLLFSSFNSTINDAEIILRQVITKIEKLNKMSYTLKNFERINGEVLSGTQIIISQIDPFKCHVYMVYPNKGAELIFNIDQNKNKAIYKPNSFPYLPINLDPLGSLMRNNNHHTIFEVGFKPVAKIINNALKEKNYDIKLIGNIKWNNEDCHHIVLTSNKTGTFEYTVKQGESLRNIAAIFLISEYRIIEENLNIKSFNQKLIKGQKIKIPRSYADKINLYISKQTHVPIYQDYYDSKGLFEKYEYRNLKINIEFKEKEFDLSK